MISRLLCLEMLVKSLKIKQTYLEDCIIDITDMLSSIFHTEKSEDSLTKINPVTSFDGYELYNVAADGNCAFRALSFAFHGNEDQHENIRAKTAEIMQQNREISISQRGNQIQIPDTWVGLETLFWAHKYLNRNIFVIIQENGNFYSVYIDDNNSLAYTLIKNEEISKLLKAHNQDICLYFSNFHFQAIKKKNP